MKTTLTKQERRGLLNLGLSNLIDLEMYLYLLSRITLDNCVAKLNYKNFHREIKATCPDLSLSERNVYRIFERLKNLKLVKVQVAGFGEALVEVKNVHEMFCHVDAEMTKASNVVVEKNESQNKTGQDTEQNDTEAKRIRQQQLIYANQKARSAGIDFGEKGLYVIAQYPREELDKVFQHYLWVRNRYPIPSASGWIISNLRQKWHRNFNPMQMFKSVTDKYFELQDLILETAGSIPTRCEQLNLFQTKKYDPRPT